MDKPIKVFDEADLCDFELRRQRNILANRDFMIQCGKCKKCFILIYVDCVWFILDCGA